MKSIYLAAAVLAAAGAAQAAEITIYKQPGFSGEQLTLRDQGTNLDSRFTDLETQAQVSTDLADLKKKYGKS